jgi:hypothetical protein
MYGNPLLLQIGVDCYRSSEFRTQLCPRPVKASDSAPYRRNWTRRILKDREQNCTSVADEPSITWRKVAEDIKQSWLAQHNVQN